MNRSAGKARKSFCRKHWLLRVTAGCAIIAVLVAGNRAEAQQSSPQTAGEVSPAVLEAAELFPPETTLFIHAGSPSSILEQILEHPLRERIEQLEPVRKGLAGPQFAQLRTAVAYLETRIGEKWQPALQSLTKHGVAAGFDLRTQSTAIAVHAEDEQLLSKTIGEVLGFARRNAEQRGKPFEIVPYREGKIAESDQFAVGRFGNWLLVSNKADFLRNMADRLPDRDGSGEEPASLAGNEWFRTALQQRDPAGELWAFADLDAIRDAGLAPELFRGSIDDPGAELIFGGVFEALRDASYAAASLLISPERIAVKLEAPFQAEATPEIREYLLGTRGMGRAPQAMDMPGLIGQVATYRDLGRWWTSKEELFPENVVARLALGDSQLSTVFGGVDFGSDVLGALQPGMRLLVRQQEYPAGQEPDIRLPAFALVARLQNPADARRFRISFQSLVGLLNLSGDGMERPQIEIITSRENGIEMTAGEYLPDDDTRNGLMIYNFSPALAFQDDYMILSSSSQFAMDVAEATRSLADDEHQSESNTHLNIDASAVRAALVANREPLVAQVMLNDGLSREKAGERVDLTIDLLRYVRDLSLDYRVQSDATSIGVELRFAEPPAN